MNSFLVLISPIVSFLAIAFFSAQTSLAASASPWIVGGKTVKEGTEISKSTVALVMESSTHETTLCTGSILAKDVIITAAHCVYGKPIELKIVFSDKVSRKGAESIVDASHYIAHPSYDPRKAASDENDIALVFFPGGLPENFAPAQILPAKRPLKNGETVVLAGFGITNGMKHVGAGTLRQTEVTILKANFGKTEVVLDQTHNHGACHGDSGGPAFVRDGETAYLWGVTSRSYPNGAVDDCEHDSVYTKIEPFADFIRKTIQQIRH